MMMSEQERAKAKWQLYQIDVPGPNYQRTVVAASLVRALELAMSKDDELGPGEMLAVWNVTTHWICHSPQSSQSTWSLLKERREGLVEYDFHEGWMRVQD